MAETMTSRAKLLKLWEVTREKNGEFKLCKVAARSVEIGFYERVWYVVTASVCECERHAVGRVVGPKLYESEKEAITDMMHRLEGEADLYAERESDAAAQAQRWSDKLGETIAAMTQLKKQFGWADSAQATGATLATESNTGEGGEE